MENSDGPIVRLLKEPAARKGFLEREKFEELEAHLATHLRPPVLFLYWCGVRLCEALQIEWPQVNLEQRTIRLEEEQTKNSEPRVVPLASVLVATLAEIEPRAVVFSMQRNFGRSGRKVARPAALAVLSN